MKKKIEQSKGMLFTLPHFSLFLIFIFIPTIFTIVISFFQWDLYSPMQFVGLDNYRLLFVDSTSVYYQNFWNGLTNTLTWTIVAVPIGIIVPLVFAGMLNEGPPLRKLWQSILYFPSILSVSTVVITWSWLFRKDVGLINNFFNINISWTGEQPWAFIALQVLTIWWIVGGNMIIYLAGMNNISEELYESASIDGANRLTQFFKITVPQLKSQLQVTLMLTLIAAFNIFAQPWLFNNGGEGDSNKSLIMYIRELVFGSSTAQAGVASAMAVILGAILILSWLILSRLFKEKNA